MSDHMPTPKEFLTDFTKDLVRHPGNRPELIAGYARHMEARELAARIGEVESLGGNNTVHSSDAGGFCRKRGEQFRKCLQCFKDDRVAELRRQVEVQS
jgi:hypothetical protein